MISRQEGPASELAGPFCVAGALLVEEAERLGLVNHVVPDEELHADSLAFARRLATRFHAAGRPAPIELVLGPDAPAEIAARLVSPDKTTELLVAQLSTSFVSPVSHEAVRWLDRASTEVAPPAGLQRRWTGDAVIGRDYMENVQKSLDRAAIVTVFLLLAVITWSYRDVYHRHNDKTSDAGSHQDAHH